MPRPRNAENTGLPARWRTLHGAYYYQVPTGLESAWDGKKLFRLGKTLPEAYKVWAERIGRQDDARTVGGLLDRYALEVVPKKAPKSRTENLRYITKLRGVFGEMALESIRPQMIYIYVDRRSEKTAKGGGVTIAHREIELLSHAFTKAVEWGYIDRHPFKGEVRLSGERPRDRYVEDWEIIECLALDSRRKKGSVRAIQAYIRIKLMTGLSRSDLLRLKPAEHFQDDGIHTQRHKTKGTTGKRAADEWSPIEPPAGAGYQIWDTVSEGSPISPVFATPEDLAKHMNGKQWGADKGSSYETWLSFINGPGRSPSMVIDGDGARTGADAAF